MRNKTITGFKNKKSGGLMNDDDLIKLMLKKFSAIINVEKGQKYITYGELKIKYDMLVVKKKTLNVFFKNEIIAIIK